MKTTAMKTVTIRQDPLQPVERDVLATAITKIAASINKLTASGVNKKAVVVLVHHDCKVPMRDIEAVLFSIGHLQETYTK